MRSQPSVHPVTGFTRAEWDLLVRLPGQVVVAATSAGADEPGRSVAEGLAGIDAIAAGVDSPNPFVRRVVEMIYAEFEDDAVITEEFVDRAAGVAGALAHCRQAAGILASRAPAGDREAYTGWLRAIATRVCQASLSDGVLGMSAPWATSAGRKFLSDLDAALSG